MLRGRKSRKNILSLLETLQLQPKQENADQPTEERALKKTKKKRKSQRTKSVSPRGNEYDIEHILETFNSDEGYNTSNEKIYDIFELSNEDSDDWNLAETDDDLEELKSRQNDNYDVPIKDSPPVRNQTATLGNLFNQMVSMKQNILYFITLL